MRLTIVDTLTNFPRTGAALDAVKLIACLLMVVDHVNLLFLDMNIYLWLVGRLVFPLFAFIVAVHVLRGISPKKYLLKLLPFAALSQIPYVWVFWEPIFLMSPLFVVLNVIFTLGVGGVLAAILKNKSDGFMWFLLLIGLIFDLLSPTTIFEFGPFGLLLPLTFVRLIDRGVSFSKSLQLLICLGLCNVQFDYQVFMILGDSYILDLFLKGMAAYILVFITIIFGGGAILNHIKGADLNDKKRFMLRYFFHIFYPGHLIVIGLLVAFGIFS